MPSDCSSPPSAPTPAAVPQLQHRQRPPLPQIQHRWRRPPLLELQYRQIHPLPPLASRWHRRSNCGLRWMLECGTSSRLCPSHDTGGAPWPHLVTALLCNLNPGGGPSRSDGAPAEQLALSDHLLPDRQAAARPPYGSTSSLRGPAPIAIMPRPSPARVRRSPSTEGSSPDAERS